MSLTISDRWGLSSTGQPGAVTLSSSYSAGGSTVSISALPPGVSAGTVDLYFIVQAFVGATPDGTNTEEVFHATSISGSGPYTFTVTGAQAGTSASDHGSGANVLGSIWTAAAFNGFAAGITGKIVPNSASSAPTITSVPNDGWSTVNGAVLDDFLKPVVYIKDGVSSLNWRLAVKTLSDFIGAATTYTIIFQVATFTNSLTNSSDSGFYLYDGTKLYGFEMLTQSTGGTDQLRIQQITSVTSDHSTAAGPTLYVVPYTFTGKIVEDGTHRTWSYWASGGWTQMLQESSGAWLTPTKVGIGGVSVTSNANDFTQTTLNYLSVTSP